MRSNRNRDEATSTVDAPEFSDAQTTENTGTDTETIPAADGTATTPEGAAPAPEKRGFAPDRGDIGTVEIVAEDDEEWGAATRQHTSNNPVALAVQNAEINKVVGVVVEDDATKIERVKRMLRAAKTRRANADGAAYEMNIHPVIKPIEDRPGFVKVRFRLVPAPVKATATPDAPATDGATPDSPTE